MTGVSLSLPAARYLQERLSRQETAIGVRLGVVDSGCSGLSYKLDLALELNSDDHIFEQHGIKLVVDNKSLEFLEGTRIDCLQEGLNESLKFENPNANVTCGCGESFSVSK